MNLYSWLKAHAKARPAKIAIRLKDSEISFGELYSLTDSFGTALSQGRHSAW